MVSTGKIHSSEEMLPAAIIFKEVDYAHYVDFSLARGFTANQVWYRKLGNDEGKDIGILKGGRKKGFRGMTFELKKRKIMCMNKTSILLVVFCLGSLLSITSNRLYAQEQQTSTEKQLQSKFGIKAGLNLTNLYISDASDEHLKAGFNAGIYWKLPVARGFSIQPELLYSQKGAKTTYSNFIQGSGEYRFNLNYIELPLLAVINLGKHFNIHAGPYAGYLVKANVTNVDNNGTINGAADLNENNFNRWDYGVAGGIGLDVENFTIGARYNYGLNKIGNSGLAGEITRNSKNAGLSIYVGLAF